MQNLEFINLKHVSYTQRIWVSLRLPRKGCSVGADRSNCPSQSQHQFLNIITYFFEDDRGRKGFAMFIWVWKELKCQYLIQKSFIFSCCYDKLIIWHLVKKLMLTVVGICSGQSFVWSTFLKLSWELIFIHHYVISVLVIGYQPVLNLRLIMAEDRYWLTFYEIGMIVLINDNISLWK